MGRRVPYLAPLSLFLWSNVFFFLIQSVSGLGILTWPLSVHLSDDSIRWATSWLYAYARPGAGAPSEAYANVFNALETVHAKSLVIVMLPAFALALAALTFDQRRPVRSAFTFSAHFFTFTLLWLSVLFLLLGLVVRAMAAGGITLPLHHSLDLAVSAIEATVLAAYLYVALGIVFDLSQLRRAVTVVVLITALFVILKAYHVVVFAVTLLAT